MKSIELTDLEISIITNALNAYWHDAEDKVSTGKELMSNGERRRLGDMEKMIYSNQSKLTLPILLKFENL